MNAQMWEVSLLNPFRPAVPFWGQTPRNCKNFFPPKRDCGPKRDKSRDGAPFPKACVVNGHMTKASNTCVRSPLPSPAPIASGSKSIHSNLSSICKKVHRKNGSSSSSTMQLTPHATRPSPYGASRSMHANFCLVGENPACSARAW